jgi:hypothetical protein
MEVSGQLHTVAALPLPPQLRPYTQFAFSTRIMCEACVIMDPLRATFSLNYV